MDVNMLATEDNSSEQKGASWRIINKIAVLLLSVKPFLFKDGNYNFWNTF